MKKICALTMVRNDEFFLRKWVDYYGAELGRENLYVFMDGRDQPVPDWCPDVNVHVCDKIPGKVVEFDKRRSRFLSQRAAELMREKGYEMAIGTDTDEFLIVDPGLKTGLAEFLSTLSPRTSYSGLGVDVGQNTTCEGEIDPSRQFLSQRRYGLLSTRYTKASVITRPVTWGSGFHRVKGHNYHIEKHLYLFHFGYLDLKRIEARITDKDRLSGGWVRHLSKRVRTINLVSRRKARSWDRWIRFARTAQTIFRPPYALNKPAMLELSIVVRIPERFSDKV